MTNTSQDGERAASLSNTFNAAVQVVEEYRIKAMEPLLDSAKTLLQTAELNVAVVGRFKAGKSSFLNDLFNAPLLPVGVAPVTSIVTEVVFGPAEDVLVEFVDGRSEHCRGLDLSQYVSERANPGNRKGVARVVATLPSLERFHALRFVDTPGLDSVFTHNTEASFHWLPRIGLALVAIGVDPPLSQRDVELIRKVYQYTPHVAVLLTKIDTVSEAELLEITDFIRQQLQALGFHPHIFPYSIRAGFSHRKAELEDQLLTAAVENFDAQREALLRRKICTVLQECEQFLGFTPRAAETLETERAGLQLRIIGEREAIEDIKIGIRITAKHSAAQTRGYIEQSLRTHELEMERRLLEGLAHRFPSWTRGIGHASSQFQGWLTTAVADEMQALSELNGATYAARVSKLNADLTRSMQGFRNSLSERTREALGVTLQTTEIEMKVESPLAPDVKAFKVFDHNWEVFSWLIPMSIFGGMVRKHFERKIRLSVEANLSRLTSQWEEAVNKSLHAMASQAESRIDQIVETVADLLSHARDEGPAIQASLGRINEVREAMCRSRP